jgi:hypothetical protein
LAQEDDEWLRIPYRFTISLDGGIGMPLQPDEFNDLWNSSFPFTCSIGYVVIPQIEIKAWFTYAHWGISEIPAKNALDVDGLLGNTSGSRVTEIDGGSITTMLYGASLKYKPFPSSRLMPYVEIGGGYFQATADDLSVIHQSTVLLENSMPDASGPTFVATIGADYGINERWEVFTEFNYYLGISDTFAPGDLVKPLNAPPADTGNLTIATIILGISLKI